MHIAVTVAYCLWELILLIIFQIRYLSHSLLKIFYCLFHFTKCFFTSYQGYQLRNLQFFIHQKNNQHMQLQCPPTNSFLTPSLTKPIENEVQGVIFCLNSFNHILIDQLDQLINGSIYIGGGWSWSWVSQRDEWKR